MGLLGIACLASAQGLDQGVTDSTIRIGILCSLSGPNSSKGRDLVDGLETVCRYINDTGGIHGRSIALVPRDDGANPEQGVVVVRELFAGADVFVLASASGERTNRALIEQSPLRGAVPSLSMGGFSRSLVSAPRKNVFFFGMPYGDQVVLAIEHVLKERPGANPKMGLLFQEGSTGEEIQGAFRRVCNHYGLQIMGEARYGQGKDDFAPLVDRLRSAGTDHAVLGVPAPDLIRILRESDKLEWRPQFIGPSSTVEPELQLKARGGANGLLVVDYLARPWERAPGVTLMRKLTEKYHPEKETSSLHRYHILGYVSGLLVAEALQRAGRELTRKSFVQAVEGIHGLKTHGLVGEITYGSNSQLSHPKGRVYRFDQISGRFITLTGWSQPLIQLSE
jgi:branched-chain amino acid transport system substrate-binding protein